MCNPAKKKKIEIERRFEMGLNLIYFFFLKGVLVFTFMKRMWIVYNVQFLWVQFYLFFFVFVFCCMKPNCLSIGVKYLRTYVENVFQDIKLEMIKEYLVYSNKTFVCIQFFLMSIPITNSNQSFAFWFICTIEHRT